MTCLLYTRNLGILPLATKSRLLLCNKCNFSSIRAAKRLLTEIVEKGRPAPAFHHNDGPGMTVQEIMVPASKAGLVIGKGGETIKSLQVSVQPVFKNRT